ncbi:OmpA family protein [Lutibacter sp. A64]|uniref:OmpA family protein n=1 Tax=Lutibacter sp. A64 TaxID=2918526 RepID=UPI001F06F570|nr:OmpA family protein [Lutibacter sp. A64]UMB55043.1 OmpA family protein [Lutibacter sp. A64]
MTKNLIYTITFLISSILFGQQKEYKIFNSEVNSKYAELGVNFLNAKTVLFASSKKTANDRSAALTKRLNKKQLLLEFYVGTLNDSSDIIETNRIKNESFIKFNESDFALSPNKKTIYFCGYNYYTEEANNTRNRQESIKLFKADIDANFNISNVSQVTFSNPNYSIKNPSISKDGKKLFFAANMPDSYGYYDIYVSNILNDGSLTSPKNLGSTINTSDDDLYPFVDKNNTLYFASFGHKGQGSLDIFKSEFINGTYGKVENLPAPINSKSADFGYATNPKNDTGFFVSNRKKGKGDVDIYGFKLVDVVIECNQLISGLLIDKNNQKPIANATLKIYNTKNQLLDSLTSTKDGSYQFNLNCNETFKISAEKEHYSTNEISFKTDATLDAEIVENIELSPVQCTQKINGLITDKLTTKNIENSSLKLYKNGEIISEKTTLKNALYTFELECNNEYIIIATKEGFHPTEIKINTDSNYNKELTINLALSPLTCNQSINGVISNKLTKEPLINTDLKFFKNTVLITSETLNNRSNFNFELECEATYKITIQKEGFLDEDITITTDKQAGFTFTTNIELTPIKCNQLISGTISNSETNELLNNTTVKLFKNNALIDSQLSENKYSFKIECEEIYKISVEKDGFQTTEITLNSDNKNEFNHIKNIELTPIKCNQLISGTISNSETNELLNNETVKLFKNDALIDSQFSENKYSFKIDCDENYKVVVEKEGFQTGETTLNSDDKNEFNHIKNIKLTPIECNQLISGTISNSETNELLNNVTVKLFKNNALIDSQLSENKYSFKIECEEIYKISVEKEGFQTAETTLNSDNKNEFNHIKNIKLTPIECNQNFIGKIIDENTEKRLNNLKVSLFENNLLKATIDLKAFQFNFDLDCDTTYKIRVEKTNYENTEITFSTDTITEATIEKIIQLKPIDCVQILNGTILNKVTELPITTGLITVFSNEKKLKETLIGTDGNFNLELNCNIKNSILITSKGHEPYNFTIEPTTNYNIVTTKTIYLNLLDEFIFLRNQKMVKTNKLNFELNQDIITPKIAVELNKVVAVLQNYPTLKIEVKSHTDSRAPDNYSMELSNKRAASIISYISSKGIDTSRIFGKGYGETELINGCSNGVKCSEKDHLLNRRTEFIVIEE